MNEDPALRLQRMLPVQAMAAATRAALRRAVADMATPPKPNRSARRRQAATAKGKP